MNTLAKTLPLAFAALLFSAPALYADPDAIKAALADPARGKDADIDARRHPGELAAFAGIKSGDVVVDLIPGTGYFTKVFSPLVGHDGRVYAVWPDAYATVDGDDLAPMLTAMQDKHYDNVRTLFQPADKFTTPRPADVVFTSQNYHDYPDKFMGNIDPKVLDAAVFAALKPGGGLHRGRPRRRSGLGPARHRHAPPHRSRARQSAGDRGGLHLRRRKRRPAQPGG